MEFAYDILAFIASPACCFFALGALFGGFAVVLMPAPKNIRHDPNAMTRLPQGWRQ